MLLKEIALHLKGTLYGDGEIDITGINEFSKAQHGDIVYIVSDILSKKIDSCNASALLTPKKINSFHAQIVTENHKSAFAKLLKLFYTKGHTIKGISKKAIISKRAKLSEGVSVGANATICEGAVIGKNAIIYQGVYIGKGVKIGDHSLIYPNVVIMDDCQIGNNVVIHSCSVIGADGFGYVYEDGIHKKIPQVGNVIIEDDVEIGANTTIDRATLGSTIIGKGSKIDNLVQIGHNVKIGKNVIIVAQTGIGGSTIIGDGVVIAGQSGISDHAEIESGSVICARSGVTGKLPKNIYLGMPAKPFKKSARAYEILHKLPEFKDKLDKIENELINLKRSINFNG